MSFKFLSTGGKPVFGLVLQFEVCGCKHLDALFGLIYLRVDFGRCPYKPPCNSSATTPASS